MVPLLSDLRTKNEPGRQRSDDKKVCCFSQKMLIFFGHIHSFLRGVQLLLLLPKSNLFSFSSSFLWSNSPFLSVLAFCNLSWCHCDDAFSLNVWNGSTVEPLLLKRLLSFFRHNNKPETLQRMIELLKHHYTRFLIPSISFKGRALKT